MKAERIPIAKPDGTQQPLHPSLLRELVHGVCSRAFIVNELLLTFEFGCLQEERS